jgi:deoxyuridine 5'-triphosphate nucleotidohydrolase
LNDSPVFYTNNKTMDRESASYLLGLVLSGGCVKVTSRPSLHFALKTEILEALQLNPEFMQRETHAGQDLCMVTSDELIDLFRASVSLPEYFEEDAWHFMNAQQVMRLNDTHIVRLPFVKGFFEGSFWCNLDAQTPVGGVVHYSRNLIRYITDYIERELTISVNVDHDNTIKLAGINLLDTLARLHEYPWFCNYDMRRTYFHLCNWRPKYGLSFQYKKDRQDAVAPFKARASDSGWDLTILNKVKEVNGVEFFDTGIIVDPPLGYYFDLVPRSSLSKTGYMLANSVGIIDRGYRASILVPLVKVHADAPDLTLPFRAVQIIPRHIVHMESREVTSFGNSTSRSEGGFGSTTGF